MRLLVDAQCHHRVTQQRLRLDRLDGVDVCMPETRCAHQTHACWRRTRRFHGVLHALCNVADSSTTFRNSSRSLDHKMSLPDKASNQIFPGRFTLSTRGGGVETVTYSCVDNDELELSTSTKFLHQDTQCCEHLRLTTDVYVVDK